MTSQGQKVFDHIGYVGTACALLIALMLSVLGCRHETPRSTPTTSSSVAVPALPTATPLPTVTPAPPTSTPTSVPTPTPCALPALPTLKPAYLAIELGCPLNPGRDPLSTAYAPFVGGQMLWREDNAVIYVLANDGRWAQYDDLWREGDAEFTCGEPANPPTPVRGFGRVWCDQPAVRQGLGAATAAEIGDAGGQAQDFVNGMILAAPDGSLFVLVGETATWRRVWPND